MPKWITAFCNVVLLLSLAVNASAQTTPQVPARSGHVNDFAGVVNEKTREQLENILTNLKLKTGIEFDIATVETTGGQDISDFSLQLARDWNIATRTSAKKSLLLVLAVNEKSSFTRFSRSVQNDLPEGVLGEMGQRLRALVDTGQFSEGLSVAVQHLVRSLSEKLAFSTDDFDKPPAVASETNPAAGAKEISNPSTQPEPVASPAIVETVVSKAPATRNSVTRPRKSASTIAGDEAESEEVELTLTKPLEERVTLLKAFLDSHPESKSRSRATELLVSSRAALGDERLKKGDSARGSEQLLLAIADAPGNPSDKLFSGVISQIPLNLYLRNESAAAMKAAQDIEAKFASDARKLAALSGFYISIEQGAEATRVATQAVQLAPDLAETHQALGRALHISLRLDEAVAEYKRALELDPNSKASRRGLADLSRAFGKADEALIQYRQLLEADPNDKAARTGMVISLLDLGRAEEAKAELDKALEANPPNLTLLAGAAYWFAAHNDTDQSFNLASKAVAIEPRYTWSQIALARTLIAQRKPLDAERALRFARQYGKFPTLDYELASALTAAGLYDEAAEILMQSFSLKDGQIESRLGGQALAHATSFIELLAPERRASIFQSTAADTESNAKLLKALLAFASAIDPDLSGGTISEQSAIAAAKEFATGDDAARAHRELYAASRLLQRGVGFQAAYELAEAARTSADAGLTVPELTLAVQADEFRSIRSRAIAAGGTPDIPEAPRNVLSNLLRGRIEDISGWALFNQDKLDEAVDHLKRAVTILPEGTPAARASLWHLGVALERQDKKAEALSYYIKSYNSGEFDPVRRAVIEQLYRKVYGSLDGLDERIGPATSVSAGAPSPATDKPFDLAQRSKTPGDAQPAGVPNQMPLHATVSPTASPTPAPETSTSTPAAPSGETTAPATEQSAPAESTTPPAAPAATPEPAPTATPTPEAPADTSTTAKPESGAAPVSTPSLDASPVEKMVEPARTTLKITGRIKDANGAAVANVVIVLISPQGSVLASTTDEQGAYSFTVAASSTARSYRIIPSKDGLVFEPIDRVLPLVNEDVKEMDFVGTPVKQSVRTYIRTGSG